jgi:hypothetical protein
MIKEIYAKFIKKPERTSKRYTDLTKLYEKTDKLSFCVEDFNKFVIGVFELAAENTQRIFNKTESPDSTNSTDLDKQENPCIKEDAMNYNTSKHGVYIENVKVEGDFVIGTKYVFQNGSIYKSCEK